MILRSCSHISLSSNEETGDTSDKTCLRFASHLQAVTDPGCLVGKRGTREERGVKSCDL